MKKDEQERARVIMSKTNEEGTKWEEEVEKIHRMDLYNRQESTPLRIKFKSQCVEKNMAAEPNTRIEINKNEEKPEGIRMETLKK